LCGEVADAAVLCPSFYKADIIQNPSAIDRLLDRTRKRFIGAMAGSAKNGVHVNGAGAGA
jgi:indolepyruvate ferredoxin oxidoreductase alpha subunit